jgi:hypothetical protein
MVSYKTMKVINNKHLSEQALETYSARRILVADADWNL